MVMRRKTKQMWGCESPTKTIFSKAAEESREKEKSDPGIWQQRGTWALD